jgi:glucuronide carrier protein
MSTTTARPAAAPTTAGRLRLPQLFGYAAGDAANNLVFSMQGMFLLLYYTDVVGISAAAAGTIFLVIRIWDAVADLFAGQLVDRTTSRWGKFRPWILFGSLPVLLLSVAAFSVPDLSYGWKIVYACVTYAALVTAYTMVNIPYGSLAAAMTQRPGERSKLATARSMGAAVAIMALAVVVSPQIEGAEDLQASLTTTTLVFVGIGAVLYLFTFLTARESVERDVTKISLMDGLRTLKGNRPLLMLCASSLVFLTGMFALQAVNIYYARDVLGDASSFMVLTVLSIGCMFLVAPAVPPLVRRLGKRRSYVIGGVVTMVGSAGVMFAPASTPWLAFVFYTVLGLGLGLVNTLMWALEADTVEYGEWKTGARTEGTTYAVFSLVRNSGQALGGAAAAYTIGLAGYTAGQAVQSEQALWGIRAAAGLIPLVTAGIAVAIMVRYPLTEAKFRELVGDVAARRAARKAEDEAPSTEA